MCSCLQGTVLSMTDAALISQVLRRKGRWTEGRTAWNTDRRQDKPPALSGMLSLGLLRSLSIHLLLVLLVHVLAQVLEQAQEGICRYTQEGTGKGRSRPLRLLSQREWCQGWQSWSPGPDIWGPEHLPLSHASCWSPWSPFWGAHPRWAVCLILLGAPPEKCPGLPPFPGSSCFLTDSLNACLAWHLFLLQFRSCLQSCLWDSSSPKLLTRIGGDCCSQFWLGTDLSPRRLRTQTLLTAPSPLAPSQHGPASLPACCAAGTLVWLQPALGTDAVKAFISYQRCCYL